MNSMNISIPVSFREQNNSSRCAFLFCPSPKPNCAVTTSTNIQTTLFQFHNNDTCIHNLTKEKLFQQYLTRMHDT